MNYIEYIFEGICFFFCLLHLIHSFFSGRSLSKKIDSICDKCGKPVEDKNHKCDLTDCQLKALTNFVMSLKEGDDNVN